MISYKEGSSYFSATLLRITGLQKICEAFCWTNARIFYSRGHRISLKSDKRYGVDCIKVYIHGCDVKWIFLYRPVSMPKESTFSKVFSESS